MTRANHPARVRAPDPVPDAEGNYTRPAMKKGGKVKKYARGGGIESKGKTRGKFV
jgi:hypothetical protein